MSHQNQHSTGESKVRRVYLDPSMLGEKIVIGLIASNDAGQHLTWSVFNPMSLCTIIGVQTSEMLGSLMTSAMRLLEAQLQQEKDVTRVSADALAGLVLGEIEVRPCRDLSTLIRMMAPHSGFLSTVGQQVVVERSYGPVGHA